MNKIVLLLITTIISTNIFAQTADTISFIQSKKMSEADLVKKREGTFITGIPDFSSDPVTGLGQEQIFIGTESEKIHFLLIHLI